MHDKEAVCDGPALSGPSEEEEWADAAASNPETENRASNPRALPGQTEQRQAFLAPGILEEGKTLAGEHVREGGVMEEEDGRRHQRPVRIPKSSGGWKWMGSAPEGSTALAAAQEVHYEVSSHASGEAWLTQVHP
ncbi:hypothetical protein NDU88_004326 [Pleurodeles waltl]|uniref:Uncharacterized protein n=1 Tax=Pleurodeles waltl TaxID=8319 RepID=A0AAV7SIG9_PLEWA|nr:hypothetical protein NDU88_004326 [Pleurodeles waltl]